MARNRIIYQSQSVMIDGNVAKGVQNVSYGLDVSREDVLQFGDLGAVDRIVLEAPVANMETNMYIGGLSAAQLQQVLQKGISGTAISVSIGLDANEGADYGTDSQAVTITSGSVTSMSAEASVGAIPTLTMGFEGTDLSYAATTIGAPATNIDVATQSGVIVGIQGAGTAFTGHYLHPQSCTVSFDLGVEGLQELNLIDAASANTFQYARVPSYPATASMELESFAVDKGMSMTLASLQQKASAGTAGDANTGGKCNVNVKMGTTKFSLVNATLDSVAFSNAIGDTAATVNATFACSIGGTASDSTLIIS